ncbi:SAM-dependent methyltransferase [Crossiella sp. CA198]|uniref:SAM-dependent methyltransferase n=1 Tax=Crossiella sp. CA198 TaxID=3455607 RepID=UPI003F8D7928
MRDWQDAWWNALYSNGGFFTRGERPAGHFRTAPLVGPELAEALLVLLDRVDHGLDRPSTVDFVDLGAGGGELAEAVLRLAPPRLSSRLRVTAVDLGPSRDIPGVQWFHELPEHIVGLLVGHEWLDAIPCPVVTVHNGLIRRVLVDEHGAEEPGPEAGTAEREWLRRWWPGASRAEVGTTRDAAWAAALARVRGAALAVDYGHLAGDRPGDGTLTGYRAGRQARPVPDGSCDLTAHVAMDACASAAAAGSTVLRTQSAALRALGLTATAPPSGLAATDPAGWLSATAAAGRAHELLDPAGLGGFHWLLQSTAGTPAPELMRA